MSELVEHRGRRAVGRAASTQVTRDAGGEELVLLKVLRRTSRRRRELGRLANTPLIKSGATPIRRGAIGAPQPLPQMGHALQSAVTELARCAAELTQRLKPARDTPSSPVERGLRSPQWSAGRKEQLPRRLRKRAMGPLESVSISLKCAPACSWPLYFSSPVRDACRKSRCKRTAKNLGTWTRARGDGASRSCCQSTYANAPCVAGL
jgi:hypothetical protein